MAKPGSYEDRHVRARDVFGRFVPGVEPERAFASRERRFGALGTFGFDVVGDLWSRPQLSRRDRSLLVICVATPGHELARPTGRSDALRHRREDRIAIRSPAEDAAGQAG